MSVIGYENLVESATVTTSIAAATGFDIENGYDYRLDDWWKNSSTASVNIDIDLGSSQSVDYFAFVGHNFSSNTVFYTLWRDSDPAYGSVTTVLGSSTPSSDGVIFRTFSSASDRYWRIGIATGGSDAPIIGHFSLGSRYEPPTSMRPGHVMPKYGIKHKYVNSINDAGLFIGRSKIREEYATGIELDYLTAAQMRTDIDPLLAHAESKSFFFLWDETNYPDEAAYCWLQDQPQISTPSAVHYSVRLNVGAVV